MKYKFELVLILAIMCLSLTGIASADSVKKTLYVDGNKVGESTSMKALSYPYPRLTVGSEGNRWYRYNGLNGQIDEFAVYNKLLTDVNVTTHFNAGTSGYVAAVTADSPLLYLRFEDASSAEGAKAANSGSVADMNSTYIGAVTQTTGFGGSGKSAVLHGATSGTGDCIDVCDTTGTLSQGDISVEFWVKTTQATDYPRFFQHNGADTEQGSYGGMYAASTNGIGLIGGDATGYFTKAINDGAWHHIVMTFHSIVTRSYATEVMADDPCVYLKFDNLLLVDSSTNYYTGGVDSNAQMLKTTGGMGKSLYLKESALVPGGGAIAWIWDNYDGNYPASADWTHVDEGYAFSGGDISFEMWIKNDPCLVSSRYGMIFQQVGAYTREPNGPGLGCGDCNLPTAQFRVYGGNEIWYPGVNMPSDGKWHQAVVTYQMSPDGNNQAIGLQFYYDGALANSKISFDPNGNLGPVLNHLMIGAMNDQGWPYNFWKGWLDEFAIYGYVLSAERVATHYAAWQPHNCAEAISRGLGIPGDLNGDCVVDFYDFSIFATKWMQCNDPTVPGCTANW